MAVLGLFFDLVLFLHYRNAINLVVVLKLSIPALVSIPLGVVGLRVFNQGVMLSALGFIVIGYAIYGLLNFRVPKLKSSFWAYGSGFLGGLIGGAYNIPGPPVIIYADSQRWPIDEFKGNLQGFFFGNFQCRGDQPRHSSKSFPFCLYKFLSGLADLIVRLLGRYPS